MNKIIKYIFIYVYYIYIRYETTNPDNLSRENLRAMLHLAYRRCLCCFRFHPEVWLSFAQLEYNEFGSASEARAILLQAVDAMPEVAVLRIALAEFEERLGAEAVQGGSAAQGLLSARNVLKTAFDTLPSAYTFSVFQRFVRRCEGLQAARRVFTDTWRLRQDRRLGLDIFLAHAQLELEVNGDCHVAAQVMKLALNTYGDALASEPFVRLYVQILTRLGDLAQIQWICQSALGREVAPAPSGEGNTNLIVSNLESTARADGTLFVPAIQRPGERFSILSDLLEAETLLCHSGVARLDDLRKRRNAAKLAVEDLNRGMDLSTGKDAHVAGIFDAARDIYERYGISTLADGPDVQLRERVRLRSLETAMVGTSGESGATFSGEPRQKKIGAVSLGRDREAASATASGPVESQLVRELLFKLPPYNGPTPDVDSFVRHLRGTILPPRPGADGELVTSARDDDMIVDAVRPIGGVDGMVTEDTDAIAAPTREDVFRERRRGGASTKKR